MRWRCVLLVVLAWALPVQAQQREQVDLELILMVDGSGSVDAEEYELQRRGYAQALRDPQVLDAIQSGFLGQIALTYVEWSGPQLHVPIVPWRLIRGAADVEAFAAELDRQPRVLFGGGTALGNAIEYGARSIEANAFESKRRVIDVSGDGPDRNGLPARAGRDFAVAQGMTVNGLPILEGFAGLQVFFEDNVIGGPGAFSIPAQGFKDFAIAVRRKLILEIAGERAEPRHAELTEGEAPWISPASAP